MTRRFRDVSVMALAGASVLVFHSAAFAQQEEPSAPAAKDAEAAKPEHPAEAGAKQQPPQDLPPEYAPPPGYRHGPPQPPPPPSYPPPGYGPYYQEYYGPPGYPPPPPRYYRPRPYQPAPRYYYPEPTAYRSFFFGFGLGVGGVAIFPESGGGDNKSRAGLAYNLHFGFGVSPRWSIVLAADGAYSYFNGYSVDQSVWSIGPQVFLTHKLYVRAGVGVATKSVDYNADDYYDYGGYSDSGLGWTAALGFEFLQSYHSSIGLELAATLGHYPNADNVTYSKDQGTIGVNFMLNLF